MYYNSWNFYSQYCQCRRCPCCGKIENPYAQSPWQSPFYSSGNLNVSGTTTAAASNATPSIMTYNLPNMASAKAE